MEFTKKNTSKDRFLRYVLYFAVPTDGLPKNIPWYDTCVI